ncbi:MAG TPA: FAD-dependent oxidoreductase [Polyangiaceae bacterium]|nr:FAD-dependent oxidoreductase [Polyangiaceae bacterium]
MPLPPPFDGRLVHVRVLTPGVRELTFERVDGRAMEFVPGQWVSAFLPITPTGEALPGDQATLKRSYSIASAPDGSPRFDLAVTRVAGGPGSTWLHALDPGAVVRFIGPQGFFTRPVDGAPPSLLVATGTGVTPMRSMMRAAVAAGSQAPMWLLLGVRHEEDLLYRDEFEAMAEKNPCVRFEPTLSQPREAGGLWGGRRGYVQAHLSGLWEDLVALAAGGAKPVSYICGLERMISSVRSMLRQGLGLPREQVRTERYD